MHNGNASALPTKGPWYRSTIQWEQACAFFEVLLDDFRSKNLLRRDAKKAERKR